MQIYTRKTPEQAVAPSGAERGKKRNPVAWAFDFLLLPLGLLLVLYYPAYRHGIILPWDEGQHLAGIQGLLQGKILYRDIYDISAPLPEFIPYWLMKLRGTDITLLRSFYYHGAFLSLFLIYLTARKLIRNRVAVLFATTLCIEFAFINMPTFWLTRWGGFRIGTAFLVILALWAYLDSGNRLFLALSGMGAAFSLLFSPEMGLISLVLCLVGAAAKRKQTEAQDSSAGSFGHDVVRVSAGFIIGFSPWLLYCLARGALWNYLKLSFYDIPFRLTKALPYGYEFFLYSPGLSFGKWLYYFWASKSGLFFSAWIIVIIETIILVRRWKHKQWKAEATRRLTLLIFGTYLLALSVRSINPWSPQLNYSLPPLLLLFAMQVWEMSEWTVSKMRAILENHFISALLVAMPMALIIGLIFYKNIRWNNYHPYHILNPQPVTPEHGLLNLPRAKNIVMKADEADMLAKVTQFITEHTAPTDPLFVFPLDGRFYFLADRSNPTRFDIAINTAIDKSYQAEAISDLKRRPPPYVVYDKNALRLGGKNPVPNERRVPDLARYIFDAYRPIFEVNGVVLMERIQSDL